MSSEIKAFVNGFLKRLVPRTYYGLTDVCRLESGDFTTGDIAVVCGVPKKKRKLDNGQEIEEDGVATLRGGISVMNGCELIYDGVKGSWLVLSFELVKPDARKKLSEIYKEIDFTREAVHA